MARMRRVKDDEDIRKLAELAREIWNEHYVDIIGQEQVDYMLENFQSESAIRAAIREEGHIYYLVSEGGEDVGYWAVEPEPGESQMKLSKIYVRRDRRGQGLGKQMVEAAEELCRERGAEKLWLAVNKNNADSIRAYRAMGFQRSDKRVKDIGEGFVMDDYIMEKPVEGAGG